MSLTNFFEKNVFKIFQTQKLTNISNNRGQSIWRPRHSDYGIGANEMLIDIIVKQKKEGLAHHWTTIASDLAMW